MYPAHSVCRFLRAAHGVCRIQFGNLLSRVAKASVCGPVEIRVEGFAPVYGEVLFLEMQPTDGIYEPLLGYIVLEQCQAAVDMVGRRLMHVKTSDLK